MYIKQLIIQGFKSYKDQTVMDPFSPGTNVIVGRNGSGKSNFFAAIRFVLGDAYTQLSREERQALLHEGSGSAVMSAYVEIIFDNSDNRFQTGNKEVSLRRTITLKKDEYAVDKKVSNRSEVMSMLDTAGFSLKNSYYIVPQGRVTALTNMKESDRLKLLKEVAGTESYEARRAESLKIMTETNNKRGKIDELLDYIKSRMNELEEEKEELRGFQEKDRERRCLEYAYYHQQQVAFNEALEEIEQTRQGGADADGANQKLFLDGEQMVAQLETQLHEMQQSLEILNMDRQECEDDRRETARRKAKAELKVKELADSQSARDQAKHQRDADLKAVRAEIASKEADLAKIKPEYEKRKNKEAQVKQALDSADAGRQRLLKKQSRGQYKNKAERDADIDRELSELNLHMATQKANIMSADEDSRTTTARIQTLEAEIAKVRQDLESFGGNQSSIVQRVSQANDKVQKLEDERRALRREDDKLQTVIQNARSEMERAKRILRDVMDRPTSTGLEFIERYKREHDISGAYGTLADLMEVNEAYQIPVEQIAGNSLFHYVVDNEATGSLLANALHKHHGGRVTFMPLAQLRPRPVNMPRANDAVPIISKISYEHMYDKAFQQVFGKTVLCPNLAAAAQYARSHNVDGITLDGEITNKRGAMTGGYIDRKRSRLEAVRNLTKWRDDYHRLLQDADGIRKQIDRKDQECTNARSEEEKLARTMKDLEKGFEKGRSMLNAQKQDLENERNRLDGAVRRREDGDRYMREFSTNADSLEAEKKSDFKKALSASEERQLEEFGRQLAELQKQWNDASSRRREAEGRLQILDGDLRQNLHLKEDQLTGQVFEALASTGSVGAGSYADAQKELKKVQKRFDEIAKRLQKAESDIEQQVASISDLQTQKAEKEQEQQERARAIERHQKKMGKSLQRKALLTQQSADCSKSIRDLGVLPEEAFEKYERMDSAKISKRLKTVNETLRKFKHVNKKAFEQYNNFTTQQEQLLKRRKELDSSQSSIEELVAHLDRVKDESIERTFKQISKEFATIFERLVPAGHGRLIIQRRSDRRGQEEDDEEQRRSVENYTGVGISVSFNSKHLDEQQKVQQLSGGQKSLCALCLIFAIQQTDPSPMVVFDEVDANLDAQYRTAVASLLESISQDAGTQFICTTFRPEIVHVADKCYGVTFTNKTSSIGCVPTEAALSFVEGQKQ